LASSVKLGRVMVLTASPVAPWAAAGLAAIMQQVLKVKNSTGATRQKARKRTVLFIMASSKNRYMRRCKIF
jgi:hypothetical protein